MATATWVDLLLDTELHVSVRGTPKCSRRALILASLVAGSFAGVCMRSRIDHAFALAISASGKPIATLASFANWEERKELSTCLPGSRVQLMDTVPRLIGYHKSSLKSQSEAIGKRCYFILKLTKHAYRPPR